MKMKIYLPLLLLDRLRLFTVALTVSGVWLRFLLLLFVLFSLRIDDFDSVNGGGAFVDSDVDAGCAVDIAVVTTLTATVAVAVPFDCATTVAICELTFHGHANGGAFDTVSYKINKIEHDIYQFKSHTICVVIFRVIYKESVCCWLISLLVYFYCVDCCCYCWVPDDSVSNILAHSYDATIHWLEHRVNRDLMHLHWMSHWNRLYSMSPHHYISMEKKDEKTNTDINCCGFISKK